jgi:TolB protein
MFLRTHGPVALILLVSGLYCTASSAQWTNRYSKLSDFGHHVYLEQHELPILAHGPTDPAPAPDGKTLVFAAQGFIWQLDLATGQATQLTNSPAVDARPRWSPDGNRLAFVRDDGLDTSVVVLTLADGEQTVINTPTIELDPEFSADGKSVYYTSGVGDKLSLWRHHLPSGAASQLTDLPQVERNARRLASGNGLLYLHGNRAHRVLRARDFVAGTDTVVHAETLTYHLSADTHPSESLIVYSAPIDNAYHLWTMDLDDPRVNHRLTSGHPFALSPAFSADGESIYFVEPGDRRQFVLKKIATYGGAAQTVAIKTWKYADATGSVSLAVRDASKRPVTARVSISRSDGHPVAFAHDATYFDSQTGRHYFYIDEKARFTLPAGRYTALVARGPMTPVVEKTFNVRVGSATSYVVELETLWDARGAGYAAADHHVHLNGDGHHRATHQDALRVMAGEDLDVLTPMSWNRWERRIDAPLIGQESVRDGRTVRQGQEVRSHFHGHVGLLGVDKPFAPWFFGPFNPTLGNPDLTNGDVLDYASKTGGFATYVHPVVMDDDPFEQLATNPMPPELVSDGVLAQQMGLELVCAWTSPLGTAQVWYRLLNIGQSVAAMSGTDAWVDFHRTPAPGTGRTYVRLESEPTADNVLAAATTGKSFVTTGPALLFSLGDNIRPGETIASGTQSWRASLMSTARVDVVELIVNGQVVSTHKGVEAGGTGELSGQIVLPEGGWVAMRAYASERPGDAWPSMHARPFAHSSPVWINAVGSTDGAARAAAAADLLRAIDAAEAEARGAYGDVATPKLQARFDQAREKLRAMIAN